MLVEDFTCWCLLFVCLLFWRAEHCWASRQSVFQATGRTCQWVPRRSASTQLKATCAALDSKPCPLERQALIILYPLLLPFPILPAELRAALGWIWAISGRKWLSVGSWILTSFTADVRGCREQQEKKGKSGRKDQRILSGETGLCLKFQLNYEQLIWFCGCVTPCVCFPFCEEPSVTPWVALTCALQLQKPMRVLFEMQPMPTIFAHLTEWWFDLKYLYFFICKEKCCSFFRGSLVGKKLFLKHTDAVVVSAGGNSWNCFSTGGWNNLCQVLYGFIWVNQNGWNKCLLKEERIQVKVVCET